MTRDEICTPTTMPIELTAKSSPYCCASSPNWPWKRNDDDDR
jgi:hypothetical protein